PVDHIVPAAFPTRRSSDLSQLEVLGDGTQQRSFVLVDDCVEAMLFALAKTDKAYNLVHIGNVDQISINRTAEAIVEVMKLKNVKDRKSTRLNSSHQIISYA